MSLQEGLITYLFENVYEGTYSAPFYFIFFGAILFTMISAYLLGSINTSIIVSKVLFKDDIRKHGSGNAGLTNVLRTYGAFPAVLTLLGDLLKTVIAIFIAAFFFGFYYAGGVSVGDGYCYMAALFAVLGHVFPVFYGFKGGKGVLTLATAGLILSPIPFLILFAIFALIVATTKYVSLGSVVAAIFYPVVLYAYFNVVFARNEASTIGSVPGIATISLMLIAIIIVWRHKENLKRISERRENKLSFKKKPKDDDK